MSLNYEIVRARKRKVNRAQQLGVHGDSQPGLEPQGMKRLDDPGVSPRHAAKHNAEKRCLLRMKFATFCAAVIQMPCQIVKGGRRLICRLLSWNPWQGAFLQMV